MSTSDFHALVSYQRDYFRSGVTRSAEWRASQLVALKAMMKDHAEDFYAALWTDLRRDRIDADLTDVKYIASEVDHVLAHLLQWMNPRPVSTPFMLSPSHALVRFEPLGVGLIIGTWNYPVMLTLSPLIAAISGGNTAVIKPSEMAAATADVIARPSPLGLYVFTEDRGVAEQILDSTASGDAAFNDCTLQPISRPTIRRRRQFRNGQVPRRVGIPYVHERPRRSVPQHAARPGCPLPAL